MKRSLQAIPQYLLMSETSAIQNIFIPLVRFLFFCRMTSFQDIFYLDALCDPVSLEIPFTDVLELHFRICCYI